MSLPGDEVVAYGTGGWEGIREDRVSMTASAGSMAWRSVTS